ncbi:MAG: hypothetical protein PVI72_13975, partial [Desulfobacterales bacterium]
MSSMASMASTTWRMLSQRPKYEEPPRGLDALWHQAAGIAGRLSRSPGRFLQQADTIVDMETEFLHASDRRLRDVMAPLRDRFRLGRDTEEDRHLGFAIVREVAARAVGLRPYREQIAGALALEAGCVAEMATGEGKT